MSAWYEVDHDEIDIDHYDKEVSFYVCDDDNGSIYLTLSFNQIKEIASKIEAPNAHAVLAERAK